MTTKHTFFLEPLDILTLRGNKLFADAGAHGEALMPPWPSVAAGALRSRLLADGESLSALLDSFRLTAFGLARKNTEGVCEPLWPLPADVVVTDDALADASYLKPMPLAAGVASSAPLPRLPVFASDKPAKPIGGLWLNEDGIRAWLAGEAIFRRHLVPSGKLWQTDPRLGIALDAKKRRAADGKIYTTECIALHRNMGFVAAYVGAAPLAENALVRLGGDGRGARVNLARLAALEPDWQRIAREGRFRLILTTPGLFADGWRPQSLPGTLVAAAAGRSETVSGWDVRDGFNRPKPALRAVPTGSVYWVDGFNGDIAALKALAEHGLPPTDATRHAEGFGKLAIAPWVA